MEKLKQPRLEISIHAPVKGATDPVVAIEFDIRDFNPRTREGCDPLVSPAGRHRP